MKVLQEWPRDSDDNKNGDKISFVREREDYDNSDRNIEEIEDLLTLICLYYRL